MGKIKVCKHTLDYKNLVKELDNNKMNFETRSCLHRCSKCKDKVLVKIDDDYVTAKSAEKLINKLKDKE